LLKIETGPSKDRILMRYLNKALRVCAIAALAACSDSSGPDGEARLSVLLTDAPGDVLEAVVTIEQIYLQGGGEEDEASEESGRFNLLAEPVTVDLLTLVDEWMPLIEDVEIPNGQYGQLRFVVSGAYLRVEEDGGNRIFATSADYDGLPDGADVGGTLQAPSFSQSGLKVSFPGGLTIDDETTLLVDFDVADSFGKQVGNGNRWIMHPVLKGSVVEPAVAARNR
jgi:hypothetical protein